VKVVEALLVSYPPRRRTHKLLRKDVTSNSRPMTFLETSSDELVLNIDKVVSRVMRGMRKLRNLSLLLLVGIIIAASGTYLLAISSVNYENSPTLAQYAEFWTVARSGGGLETVKDSDLYVKYVPLSADPGDLRLMDLSFNVSASQTCDFNVLMQFIAGLSAPNSPIFATPWLENLSEKMSDQATMQLLAEGLATPHNLTINYVQAFLHIFANNSVYGFNLGRFHLTRAENGTLEGGVAYGWILQFYYNTDGTITYYIPSPPFEPLTFQNTVLNLGFNSGGNFSFSLQFNWNVSFEQKYGPNLKYAGNATILNWIFRKLDGGTIGASIELNNTNFRPPVPAYAVISWKPVLEISILATGIIVTVVSLVLWRKYTRKADAKLHQNV
jgi:hypothetical protein